MSSPTFITRLDPPVGDGLRLAVKDAIDVAGVPTTVGSPAVARDAEPAADDAACLAGARAAGARLVGKANLHELCFGATGVNPWFGTPVNPLDPTLVPGGSSSGSAVAVADGDADVAYGTDTAGSIRNPAACCGVVGLKTTFGRIPLDGVWPLAPSLDTIGPLGATVAAVAAGMALLEPGFAPAGSAPSRVGRVRGLGAHPVIDAAVDAALAAAGIAPVDVVMPGWEAAFDAGFEVLLAEAWQVGRRVAERHPDQIGADVAQRYARARDLPAGARDRAIARRMPWRAELASMFDHVDVLALPTAPAFATRVDELVEMPNLLALPVNLAGVPALALPVPSRGPLPASLQLIGPDDSESALLALGAVVEAAVAR